MCHSDIEPKLPLLLLYIYIVFMCFINVMVPEYHNAEYEEL